MSDKPFIVCFDLATATGVCDGHVGDDKPRLWSWYLDDAGPGRAQRLAHLRRFLDAYFAKFPPDLVIYEKPMNIATIAQMMAKGIYVTNEDTLGLLRGCVGVLESCASFAGVPEENIRGIAIQDARKHLIGVARPPDPKKATMRAVTSLGWAPATEDEADAAALWALACGQENPRMAAALGRAHLGAKDMTKNVKAKDRGAGPLFAPSKGQ